MLISDCNALLHCGCCLLFWIIMLFVFIDGDRLILCCTNYSFPSTKQNSTPTPNSINWKQLERISSKTFHSVLFYKWRSPMGGFYLCSKNEYYSNWLNYANRQTNEICFLQMSNPNNKLQSWMIIEQTALSTWYRKTHHSMSILTKLWQKQTTMTLSD